MISCALVISVAAHGQVKSWQDPDAAKHISGQLKHSALAIQCVHAQIISQMACHESKHWPRLPAHTMHGCAGQPLLARASELPGPARFRAAALVPPGYASLFFAHLYEDASCPHASELFARFRRWVMGALDLAPDESLSGQHLVRVRSVAGPARHGLVQLAVCEAAALCEVQARAMFLWCGWKVQPTVAWRSNVAQIITFNFS